MHNVNYLKIKSIILSIGFLILFTLGCSNDTDFPLKVNFELSFNGSPITCDQPFPVLTTQWRWQNVQFYLHDFKIFDENGFQPVKLVANKGFDQEVALIGGVCNQQQQWQVELIGAKPIKNATHIEFTLGVPFNKNHQNPLTQQAPLNQSDMFWIWQTGHKFLRMELMGKDESNQTARDWLLHLGSTGCSSVAPVRAPNTECKNPNRITYKLAWNKQTTIQIDFAQLFDKPESLDFNTCQSNPDDPSCDYWLPKLGLGLSTQSLFSTKINSK